MRIKLVCYDERKDKIVIIPLTKQVRVTVELMSAKSKPCLVVIGTL